MKKFANIEIAFIHRNEILSSDFVYAPSPCHLNEKQKQKWQSRRAAYFLLTELFKKNNIDLTLLDNIQRTQTGRPFVNCEEIDFNISHSGDWIAVIFSRNFAKLAVGIDIEHPTKVRRYADLIRYYGNKEEQQVLLSEQSAVLTNLAERFYLSWCLREAVLKSQGVGIVKLSEVTHFPIEKKVFTPHCPTGKLHFCVQLPFYLSYFYQQPQNMLLFEPCVFHWRSGEFHPINCQSIIYDVNLRIFDA